MASQYTRGFLDIEASCMCSPHMVDHRVTWGPNYLIKTGRHHITNLLLVNNNCMEAIQYFFYLNLLLPGVFGLQECIEYPCSKDLKITEV